MGFPFNEHNMIQISLHNPTTDHSFEPIYFVSVAVVILQPQLCPFLPKAAPFSVAQSIFGVLHMAEAPKRRHGWLRCDTPVDLPGTGCDNGSAKLDGFDWEFNGLGQFQNISACKMLVASEFILHLEPYLHSCRTPWRVIKSHHFLHLPAVQPCHGNLTCYHLPVDTWGYPRLLAPFPPKEMSPAGRHGAGSQGVPCSKGFVGRSAAVQGCADGVESETWAGQLVGWYGPYGCDVGVGCSRSKPIKMMIWYDLDWFGMLFSPFALQWH